VTDREGKNFTTLRPGEYVFMAGLMAIFATLVVLMVTRDPLTAVLAGAGIFVIVAIAIAMLLSGCHSQRPHRRVKRKSRKPETTKASGSQQRASPLLPHNPRGVRELSRALASSEISSPATNCCSMS
jgi:hypothetical protein